MAKILSFEFSQRKTTSSAYWRCEIGILDLPISAGLRRPSEHAFWVSKLRPSIAKRNKKGERGSPCLNPRLRKNSPQGLSFTKTEAEADSMHPLIHNLYQSQKLKP